MLRRFLYLDTVALSEYVTAIEGGLTTESIKRTVQTNTARGGVGARVAHVSGDRAREAEEQRTFGDTDHARFDRLLGAAEVSPEDLGWIEVLQPDVDFEGIGIGAMVSWECDLFIPNIIRTMSDSGEALPALRMMQGIMPYANRLGLDTSGLPGNDEMNAAAEMIERLDVHLVVVGEDAMTDWQVAGQLSGDLLHGDIEGRARIVGKVSEVVQVDRWKPYLTFPGMRLVSREQRRKMERQVPAEGQEDDFLNGPAVLLDLLAIYR